MLNIMNLESNPFCLNSNILLFHGSFTEVKKPILSKKGFTKDFGYGFYCTTIRKQAERWATGKSKGHILNIYRYTPNTELAVKVFKNMTEEWLDFIVSCSSGNESKYDIVEGPMADDTIWDYVQDLLDGEISRSAFWELVKFKYPTHQIVFTTEKALETLTFIRSVDLNEK